MNMVKKISGLMVTILLLFIISFQSNATTNGTFAATNHTVLRTDVAVFTSDATNSDMADAIPLSVTGSDHMEALVFIKRYRNASGEEELRIYFSVHDIADSITAVEDTIQFYFDRLHDHGNLESTSTLPDDVMLRIERSDCSPCSFNLITRSALNLFDGSGEAVAFSNSQVDASEAGEYSGVVGGLAAGWTGEFVLTPADLGWGTFPQVMGFAVRATSANQNAITNANPLPTSPASPIASYPLDGVELIDEITPDNWANLKTRYPIDYALSIDYSGSMSATDGGSDARWVRAKRSADLFVATLGLFKDQHNVMGDRVSVSQYSWSCSDGSNSGDSTGGVSGIASSPSFIDIPNPPNSGDATFTSGNNDIPPGNNCTPIKRGIEYALEDQLGFSGAGSELKDRIILLLSDGLHNTPSSDVPLDPVADFSSDEKTFTQLRTVAIGPDGVADTDLLSSIATEFNGGAAYLNEARYLQTSDFNELLDAFLETLYAPLSINQVPLSEGVYQPGAPDKLVFIGVWDDPTQAGVLSVTENGGAVVPDESYFNQTIGYAAIVVNNPTANAEWQINAATAPQVEFVLADLRILARYLVEQKRYDAGDPMLLQVSLKDKGMPLLGVNVTVEIAKPGEGLGNYLSTIQDNCKPGVPNIPDQSGDDDRHIIFDQRGKTAMHNIRSTIASAAAATSGSLTSNNNDPVPGRYALSANHFERCHKDGLDRNNLPGVKMYDDGSHGDLMPDDGVYSLQFTDTVTEGSYNARFFAVGRTTDGVNFSRTRRISQYVGIEPDPDSTQSQTQILSTTNGLTSMAVYFLPQDTLGNYMGPGFQHKFKVSTSAGTLASPLVDLNNGYYGQLIRYAAGSTKPIVTITTVDGCFEKIIGGNGNGNGSSLDKVVWILLIIAIILLLLLLWCLFKRYK